MQVFDGMLWRKAPAGEDSGALCGGASRRLRAAVEEGFWGCGD